MEDVEKLKIPVSIHLSSAALCDVIITCTIAILVRPSLPSPPSHNHSTFDHLPYPFALRASDLLQPSFRESDKVLHSNAHAACSARSSCIRSRTGLSQVSVRPWTSSCSSSELKTWPLSLCTSAPPPCYPSAWKGLTSTFSFSPSRY